MLAAIGRMAAQSATQMGPAERAALQKAARDGATRSDPVVAAAQDLLRDNGYDALPPVAIVSGETFAPFMPDNAGAFTLTIANESGTFIDPVIYLLDTNAHLAGARGGDRARVVLLAATILHEASHGRGADEHDATAAQVAFLGRVLGSGLTSSGVRSILLDHRAQMQKRIDDFAVAADR